MRDFDPINNIVQYFRSKLLYVRIFSDFGVQFPSLHASGEALNLLQDIGIQHLVVYTVGLGADFRMRVMVHAQVNIRGFVFQLLLRYCQWVAAAFAEQLTSKQIIPPFLG